jgi:hypothetical protein
VANWSTRQVAAVTRWVGAGRKLTQTGQLTMADARHLVALLETGDEIDPVIGKRVFLARSSADLPGLAIVLAWAKAAGLLRVVRGQLVPVKKNPAVAGPAGGAVDRHVRRHRSARPGVLPIAVDRLAA